MVVRRLGVVGACALALTIAALSFGVLGASDFRSVVSNALGGKMCDEPGDAKLANAIKEGAQLVRADSDPSLALPDGWQKLNDLSFIKMGDDLGLSARLGMSVYQNGNQTIAVIQGVKMSGTATTDAEYAAEAGLYLGAAPTQADVLALQYMEQLKVLYPNISMLGLSKGGEIVNYISSQLKIPGMTFNAARMPSSTEAANQVFNVTDSNDLLVLRDAREISDRLPQLTLSLCNASSTIDCHILDGYSDLTPKKLEQAKPQWSDATCGAKITDPNVILVCNPLTATLGEVENNSKMSYRNECNWGVRDPHLPAGVRGKKTSVVQCNGWNDITVINNRPGIPTDAKGYAGEHQDYDRVTGQPDVVTTYSGYPFKTACEPKPLGACNVLTNILFGGCLNPLAHPRMLK
jgi:hypothetical protein